MTLQTRLVSTAMICIGMLAWASLALADGVNNAVITPKQVEADWLSQQRLRERERSRSAKVTREADALGGCDGIKTGRWGFHTAHEANPWWQVDLGGATAIDRVVIYNRCDGMAPRNARIKVLVSDDGRTFKQVYQHDGRVFYGHTDKKPLSVPLGEVNARYVRLQLPGKSYFHLDEVEVYSGGDGGKGRNVALGKPATQSSTSQWSTHHSSANTPGRYSTAKAIERGRALAENLRGLGLDVERDVAALGEIEQKLKQLPADADDAARRKLFYEARHVARRLTLRNPLLDFDSILFVKSAPGRFPHMSDQFYGWWSRPGGGVFILENFKGPKPTLRCLTADMPAGNFLRPDLSYDGKKILFAYCRYYPHVADIKDKANKANLPEDAFYHIYEMNIDGSERRRLTRGRYDDFDARYLPDGDIVFLSTRKGTFLQCSKTNTATTATADLPDSYVRCGGGNYRPVPVFTMQVMNGDGGKLRPISAFENFEWTPAVANDGTILYTRWDYIDRFNGHFFSLWSTNPDGTNPQLVYGNYTVRPQVVCEVRSIPNSRKLIGTASAHHSILGGSLVLLDRARGTEGDAPVVRLTPEVPFPETESNVGCYYANPWPLSQQHFLVGWSNRRLPPHSRVEDNERNPVNAMGLYLYDAFGNLNLIYRDPTISSVNPIPVRPRRRPPAQPANVSHDESQEGYFFVQDIYQGLTGVQRGSIKSLRVVGVPPKVQPHMNRPNLGVSREDPGKFVLGTAPVERDGSAYFRVPSGVPVLFQALDDTGLAVQTMRSLTYVGPQQTLSCVGCHEGREAVPATTSAPSLAARREPSRLKPGPSGTWPLRYDELVQPVLDKHCVSCHRAGSGNAKAETFDLATARSYEKLLDFAGKDLRRLAHERDRSVVGDCVARQSKLLALLKKEDGHHGVKLDADSYERLITWMDLYAQRQGHFSAQQEAELRRMRKKVSQR